MAHNCCSCSHCGEDAAVPDLAAVNSETLSIYYIPQMDCPVEEQMIRARLAKIPGVGELRFNLVQRVLEVQHEPGLRDKIAQALQEIGMTPKARAAEMPARAEIPWRRLLAALALAAGSEAAHFAQEYANQGALWDIASALLALAAIFAAGLGTFKKGWLSLLAGRLNINALMSVAVVGACCIGQFPEAAMVMTLFEFSEALEAGAMERARDAIRGLLALAPQEVTARMPDGSWRGMKPEDVAPGTLLRVRPGEKIGLDGIVKSGQSSVNQASITGESIPVEKFPGDMVFAGTINEAGSFEFESTARSADTTLARIIHSVENAQATRAPVQRFVDVFAAWYTPCVFAAAILAAVIQPFLFGRGYVDAIYTGLVILVIGCPCALVISTPVSIVSAMTAAARKGILVRGGIYLEQGKKLACIAMDKTGTITSGNPAQTGFEALGGLSARDCEIIAASLAARSDHPVSRAIAKKAHEENLPLLEVDDFAALPGRGIEGRAAGKSWQLGSPRLMQPQDSILSEKIAALEKAGKTVVLLLEKPETGHDAAPMALFAVEDSIRPGSIEAIRELNSLGIKTLMLTGDNINTARAVGEKAGVCEYRAQLLPDEKLAVIQDYERDGVFIGMAGDGINDAPALAAANIGFAMGGAGSDVAVESADVAIMDDDLRKIPRFVRLSRAAWRVLAENITFAIAVKLAFFILALAQLATMWMAVFADVGATLLVVANAMRLLKK